MKKLYHYCSNQKCFSILKGKSIRMSDIQKSNDYKELSLFFPGIFDKVEELYKQKPFKFKYSRKTGEEALQQLLDESYDYWRYLDFGLAATEDVPLLLDKYVHYFNNRRPAAALGYKSPVQYKTELGF